MGDCTCTTFAFDEDGTPESGRDPHCSVHGDQAQPLPKVNLTVDVQTRLIDYITVRREHGIKKYGTALQAHNGRDALRDAFEEAVDLVTYLAQAIIERDGGLPWK